jgi:hypothetical protein
LTVKLLEVSAISKVPLVAGTVKLIVLAVSALVNVTVPPEGAKKTNCDMIYS